MARIHTISSQKTEVVIAPGGTDASYPDSFALSDAIALTSDLPDDVVEFSDVLLTVTPLVSDALDIADGFADTSGSASYGQNINITDALDLIVAGLDDSFAAGDVFASLAVALDDTVAFADALPSLALSLDDSVAFGENAFGVDPRLSAEVGNAGDNWTDAANTGVNHGSDATLTFKVDTAPVGDNTRYAFLKWDLTGVSGFEAENVPGGFTVFGRHAGLTGTQQPNSELRHGAVDPFNESTQTWANQNVGYGAQVFDAPWGSWGNSFASQSFSLTKADVDTILGRWIQLRFYEDSILVTNTYEVRSKEHTTASERPVLNLELFLA